MQPRLTSSIFVNALIRRAESQGGFGMVRVDGFGLFAASILLAITALSVLGSMRFLEREEADHGEFYPLVLIAAAGMVMMVQTAHLVMVLVGLVATIGPARRGLRINPTEALRSE